MQDAEREEETQIPWKKTKADIDRINPTEWVSAYESVLQASAKMPNTTPGNHPGWLTASSALSMYKLKAAHLTEDSILNPEHFGSHSIALILGHSMDNLLLLLDRLTSILTLEGRNCSATFQGH